MVSRLIPLPCVVPQWVKGGYLPRVRILLAMYHGKHWKFKMCVHSEVSGEIRTSHIVTVTRPGPCELEVHEHLHGRRAEYDIHCFI